MKKIKQVSLGKGRASAFPFFICATGLVHPPFYLGLQKCKESQTCLFFFATCDPLQEPLFWSGRREARHGEARTEWSRKGRATRKLRVAFNPF